MRYFIPFSVGPQPAIGLEILAIIGGDTSGTTSYHVRQTCCGTEKVMVHQSIISRRHNRVIQCPRCVKYTVAARVRAMRLEEMNREALARLCQGKRTLIERYWLRPPSLANQPTLPWADGVGWPKENKDA
jgi:hypothetical protein